ncbi:MAG: GIY-YIG nuclease family protein [Candidatus Kapaibacterium sp.]
MSGNPEGIILAYMSNWSGQAIKIPRNLFPDSKSADEINRPGVYFLIGNNEENPDDKMVYIGEANNISERLVQHFRDDSKAFFETIIAFSSKDENLTVSHTKHLELKLIEDLLKSTEYRVVNTKGGNRVSLSKMVKDEMDTFLEKLRIIIPTLGFDLFGNNESIKVISKDKKSSKLYLEVSNIKAESELTSNGLLVKQGSNFKSKETSSLSGSYSNLRKTLTDKGVIQKKDGIHIFTEDYEFTSPSQAAAIILGYSINGRTAWKNNSGETLKEIEERKIDEKPST